eukprot:15356453-Ditylum_brightwellii.AAC.1
MVEALDVSGKPCYTHRRGTMACSCKNYLVEMENDGCGDGALPSDIAILKMVFSVYGESHHADRVIRWVVVPHHNLSR